MDQEGACVAVVEGEPGWRKVLRAALERAGYDVVEVATPDALRPYSGASAPALVLVDVAPPKSFHDAVAAARAARAAVSGQAVVAVTGPQSSSQLSILARACQAVGWLERSGDASALVRGVRQLIAQKVPRPSVPDVALEKKKPVRKKSDLSWTLIKLLLIDDSEIALELMQEQLLRAGFDVRIALALSEMDSILRGWSPNVILVDVHMPEMRGDRLCARLKAQVGTDVLVVLCSNMPAAELSAVADSAGADGFVSKSDGLGQFADQVAAWCRRLSDPIVSIQ